MMHFSIADTEDHLDAYGATYTAYKLYFNGTYHGHARYREFHELNESLKAEFHTLPSFPPKRLFALSAMDLNVRRVQLEKYMQNLGQIPGILQNENMQDFLRRIALRSVEDMSPVGLQVFLLNGNSVNLQVDPKSSNDDILEAVCRELKLPSELTYYFGLYLAKEDQSRYTPFKKFLPFEIPFATLHLSSPPSNSSSSSALKVRILIKKSYSDPAFDTDVLDSPNRVGTNLLFVETVDSINRGWIVPTPEQKSQLENLQNKGSRREFVLLARTVKGYGALHFSPCSMDYPAVGTQTKPFLTSRDLVCPFDGGKQEAVFRIVRIRCWRLCFSETYKNGHVNDNRPRVSLMFEYLLAKDKLQWITILSEESIWISSCIQGMVEELMLKKRGSKIQKPELSKKDKAKAVQSESLSVSVTVTRKMTSDNSAFEEIGDEDL